MKKETKKKIAYVLVLCILITGIILPSIKKAQSGISFGPGALIAYNAAAIKAVIGATGGDMKPFKGDLIGRTVSSLANEMMEGLGALVSGTAMGMGRGIVFAMVHGLGPDTDAFITVIGGGDLKEGISDRSKHEAMSNGMPGAITYFIEISQIFGYVIAILVFLFAMMNYFWAEPSTLRETPVRLILRLSLAFILIYGGSSSILPFMNVGNKIWSDYVMSSSLVGGETSSVGFDDMQVGSVEDEEQTVTIFGWSSHIEELAMFLWMPIIIILISWPLIKGFFKMYIEIVERYLVVMLLYYFFAAAAGTVVSKQSATILKSYMRMLASQILILFMNVGFMAVFVDVLKAGGWTQSLPNYIFALAYMRIVQRVDSYMSSLGLNVAQTGGQTLDTLGGVARGMLNTVRNTAKTAGNTARQGGGQLLAAAMRNKGNAAGAAAASAIGASGGMAGVLNKASEIVSNGGMVKQGLSQMADYGKKASVGAQDAASTIHDLINNPSNSENIKRVGAMDEQSQLAGLNKILSDHGVPLQATGIKEQFLRGGQLEFTAQPIDKNGNLLENAPEISGTLSASDTGKSGSYEMGSNMYLTAGSSIKEHPGEKYTGNAQTLGIMFGQSRKIAKTQPEFQKQISAMQYNSANGGMYAIYNNKGESGQQIGLISNIDGNQVLSQSISEGATGNKESFKDYIEDKNNIAAFEKANGFESGSLSWDPNKIKPDGTAIGHASIKDEFGSTKQLDVHIRDMGSQGYNGGNITTMDGKEGAKHAFAFKTRETKDITTAASMKNKRGQSV